MYFIRLGGVHTTVEIAAFHEVAVVSVVVVLLKLGVGSAVKWDGCFTQSAPIQTDYSSFFSFGIDTAGHMNNIRPGCAPEGAREGSSGEDCGASGKSSLRTSGCLGSRVMSKVD